MSKKHYLGVDDINPIYCEENSMWSTAVNLEGIRVRIGNREDYFPCDEYEVLYPDICRKQAQDETWAFVKICTVMCESERQTCFGLCSVKAILEKYTYKEAKNLYDAWVKRITIKEMTVEEISEALGCDVKIVAKKEQA